MDVSPFLCRLYLLTLNINVLTSVNLCFGKGTLEFQWYGKFWYRKINSELALWCCFRYCLASIIRNILAIFHQCSTDDTWITFALIIKFRMPNQHQYVLSYLLCERPSVKCHDIYHSLWYSREITFPMGLIKRTYPVSMSHDGYSW